MHVPGRRTCGGGVGEVVEKVPEKGAEREGKRVDRQPLAMDKLT